MMVASIVYKFITCVVFGLLPLILFNKSINKLSVVKSVLLNAVAVVISTKLVEYDPEVNLGIEFDVGLFFEEAKVSIFNEDSLDVSSVVAILVDEDFVEIAVGDIMEISIVVVVISTVTLVVEVVVEYAEVKKNNDVIRE